MFDLTQLEAGCKALLSGNEAIALGAFHAGLKVATAYPGTPSTEILENLARFEGIYSEWSTNEKVAVEVAMGASYTGVRSMASMKHVGLNVAADPLLSASITGIKGGLVIISADDPGMHSSQNEQDNRHYARLAKIPVIEPYDSQSAYRLIRLAFDISELFDTPVLFRTTTRVSHSKSVVTIEEAGGQNRQAQFEMDPEKYVMLPAYARKRHVVVEERMEKIKDWAESGPLNEIIAGDAELGIITCGIAYQYAREVFPDASILRLGMTYPLPEKLIKSFADGVKKLLVIEELDPFVENIVKAMGIKTSGKNVIPITGELSPQIVASAAQKAGLLTGASVREESACETQLPPRPPSLCPGCPHRGLFYALARNPRRLKKMTSKSSPQVLGGLVVTGDIGCYTLGAFPPLSGLDTCACMGASIGHAIGMEKAGLAEKVVAVIGDSTFMHSGLTALADAVYNRSAITVIILDNMTTAMTGHQGHPATGITAGGEKVKAISLEDAVKGIGVEELSVVDAFDIKALREAVKSSIESDKLSVLIVRGECAPLRPRSDASRAVDIEKCTRCNSCFKLACPAIQYKDEYVYIDPGLCAGDICGLCEQVCPVGAIGFLSKVVTE